MRDGARRSWIFMKGNLRRILIRPVKHITYAKRRIKTLANHPNSQYLLFFSNRKPIFRRCVHFNAAPHKGRGRPNLQKSRGNMSSLSYILD
jgi:hypothetical protein